MTLGLRGLHRVAYCQDSYNFLDQLLYHKSYSNTTSEGFK